MAALVAVQDSSNYSIAVVYYNSDLTRDMSIGNQGIVSIPVPTAWPYPIVTGLRAVYMPDGERTVVVGSVQGTNAAGATVSHFVVARIWN
ncbi:MAG: hypothetical protein FWD73_17310 [Polyangiaceae bacterium]|nr:hypothetical protein [Polyangiaceae bacterium]